MSETSEKQLVKSASRGGGGKYSYSYSSLADIVKQGFKIPQMRIKSADGLQFVEWKDEAGEWQQGAQIVPLDSGSMNSVQKYGASMTYARRYTTMLALGLVSDDDDKIEAEENRGHSNRPASEKQINYLNSLYRDNPQALEAINSGRLTAEQASELIERKRNGGNQ